MIVVLKCPFTLDYKSLSINFDRLIKNLKKIDQVSIYDAKFSFTSKNRLKFNLEDLKFESVSADIHKRYGNKKIFLVGIEHGSPYALHYSYHYSKYCSGIVTFPLRGYNKPGLDRRIHKFKNNKGWEKYITTRYSIDEYFLNLNNNNLQHLLSEQDKKEEKLVLFLAVELNLRKQYKKVPEIFRVPAVLYIRLDLNTKAFVDRNLKTAAIADMKKLTNENDAMIYSCVGSIEKVAEIDKIVNKNIKNNNFIVNYLPHMDNMKYDYGNMIVNGVRSIYEV